MPALARINVTPVKGTALLHPERIVLSPSGVAHDRRFFLIDEHGELFSNHEFGPLMRVRGGYDPDREALALTFPDGSVAEGTTGESGTTVTTDFHGRAVEGTVVEGPFAEALSSYVGQRVRLVRTERQGDGIDVHHVTLLSEASVRELARRGSHDGDLDARRFRMTIELEGCEPFEEDSWDGELVHVGEALLRVRGPVPRCRVTTLAPETGLKDWETLTQITKFRPFIDGRRGIPFGMYAEVERPGPAAVGDAVSPARDM